MNIHTEYTEYYMWKLPLICIIFVYVFNLKKTVNNDQNQSHSDCKATTNVMLLYIMTIINIAN